MKFYPDETDIVKFIIIPVLLPLKIIPIAKSDSMKILSNEIMSTGLCDGLQSSNNVVALNLTRSLLLSLGRKLFIGSCQEFSMILPIVEKFGLI